MATPAMTPGFEEAKLNSLIESIVGSMGAEAGEKQIRKVTSDADFMRFRRAAETPFKLVFETRP